MVRYNVSGVAKYRMVKLDPHAEQNPRSALFETLVNWKVEDGAEFDGEKTTEDTGKSINAIKAPPDILLHVLQ
jgi:hypothetical protein